MKAIKVVSVIINCKQTIFKFFFQFFSKIFFPIFIFSKIWRFSVLRLKTVIQKNEIYGDYIKHFLNISFKSRG